MALALGLLLAARPAAAQEWHEAYRSGVSRAGPRRPRPGGRGPAARRRVASGAGAQRGDLRHQRRAALFPVPAPGRGLSGAGAARAGAGQRSRLGHVGTRARRGAAEAAGPARRGPRARQPAPAPTPTPAPVTRSPRRPPRRQRRWPCPRSAARPATPPSSRPRLRARRAPARADPARASARGLSGAERVAPPRAAPERPAAPTGTLEIVSQPAGASVYIDDEPVGSTDPESGRLVKTGVSAGSHRVRVAPRRPRGRGAGDRGARRGQRRLPGHLPPLGDAVARHPRRHRRLRRRWRSRSWLVLVRIARPPAAPRLRSEADAAPGADARPRTRASRRPRTRTPGARRDEHGHEWFGDFRLLEMLGRGGMASVFKAERRGELSALKRPLGELPRRPGVPRAVPARGRDRPHPEPPEHRAHPRARRGGGRAVLHHGAAVGRDAAGDFIRRRGAAEPRAAAAHRGPGRGGAGLRPHARASCTATSSRPTSCCSRTARPRSWTSASPGPAASTGSPRPGRSWAPPSTWPRR